MSVQDPLLETEPMAAPPQLIIGLVGAVGSGLSDLSAGIVESLKRVRYDAVPIRVTDLFRSFAADLGLTLHPEPLDVRYSDLMKAGDSLRRRLGRKDAAVLPTIDAIRQERGKRHSERTVFIIHQLKTKAEVETLRAVYGNSFVLVAAYAPEAIRLAALANSIAASHNEQLDLKHKRLAEDLIVRDQKDAADPFGQNVRDAFPLADVFIDVSDRDAAGISIDRFIDLVFGDPFHTPTKEEYGMFLARAAALRSGDLSRQVGAALAVATGDVIALGTNEVPKGGGGQYWADDPIDDRDFRRGFDSNVQQKRVLIADALTRLRDAGVLNVEPGDQFQQLVNNAVEATEGSPLVGARLMSLIEFGRAVHAEMSAFMDAARRGVAVAGTTLYTTTFPCHECARHIVVAGAVKVVFIEPYPKSLAQHLHADAIKVEQPAGPDEVAFVPFVGVAPRLYPFVFAADEDSRKLQNGKIRPWNRENSEPRPSLRQHPFLTDLLERQWRDRFVRTLASSGALITNAGQNLAER